MQKQIEPKKIKRVSKQTNMRNLIVSRILVIFLLPNFHPSLAAEQHGTPNLTLHQAQKESKPNKITMPPINPITVNTSMPVAGPSSSKGT
jgi:hypothetical protein